MRETDWTYEIIVVDDGSRDNTAEEASGTGARVLRRRPNRGYGAALKLGIQMAKGEVVICDEIDLCDLVFYDAAVPPLAAAKRSHWKS